MEEDAYHYAWGPSTLAGSLQTVEHCRTVERKEAISRIHDSRLISG